MTDRKPRCDCVSDVYSLKLNKVIQANCMRPAWGTFDVCLDHRRLELYRASRWENRDTDKVSQATCERCGESSCFPWFFKLSRRAARGGSLIYYAPDGTKTTSTGLLCLWCIDDDESDRKNEKRRRYQRTRQKRSTNNIGGLLWRAKRLYNLIGDMRFFGQVVTQDDESRTHLAIGLMQPESGLSRADKRCIQRRLAREWVVRWTLKWKCSVCDEIKKDLSQWVIDWDNDNCTCRSCNMAGFKQSFLRKVLPCDAAILAEFGKRPLLKV